MNGKVLLSGNEAIARGAWEAGVKVASGYPGTPSTEIMENLAKYKADLYCEWAPNEKVAVEMAAGAALTGARSMCTMKLVGLNVAADPLMTLSYIGVEAGLVLCVADDPGQYSSQTEQDTRHYARLAKIPLLDPADAQEGKDFIGAAFAISEQYRTPVILRTTTGVSHSRSMVLPGERQESDRKIGWQKNPPKYVPLPVWGRGMRRHAEDRLVELAAAASASPLNEMELKDRKLGIVTAGLTALHVREIFPEASILKLGWPYPFPDELLKRFAAQVDKLLVIEEADDFLEEHIKALGIACVGKQIVPRCGELSPAQVSAVKARWEGREAVLPVPVKQAADLPARPPILCAGCPHRGVFYALTKFDVVVAGDIGCYSLGVFPPLDRTDVILCMGGGISMAHGIQKAGEPKKVVGIVGDSTFFHSGITGLLDIVYNRGASTIIVVDNRTTAMTGHQDHPGTGRTLMGEQTEPVSIEAIGRACGVKRVKVVNPYDLAAVEQTLREEMAAAEPSLIISRAPCLLREKKPCGPAKHIDPQRCKTCKACLKLGCPALEFAGGKPTINPDLCAGCDMCRQVCRFGAIQD